jgi:hypothetical protein
MQFMMRGPDSAYDEKRIRSRPAGSTSMVRRVISVARSLWVIVVLALVLLFALAWLSSGGEPLVVIPLVLAIVALIVGIDGYRRTCPSCRMILGAERLSIVSNEYGHLIKWRCVGCQHRWEKQRYTT